MSRCVLVAGGAGYVGSHMVKRLLAQGERVVVVDNLSNGHRDSVLTPDLVVGELGDRALLDRVFSEYPIDSVMHFAAFIEVGESVKHPARFLQNNVGSTQVLLDAMVRHGVRNLIFSSTAAVYAQTDDSSLTEAHATAPGNPYGATKLLAEQTIRTYGALCGIRSIAFRYFNAAGADPDGELGERHNPETHLIPLVLQAASGRRPSVSVYGADYPTRDGTCVRDYVHVVDLCEAHYRGLQRLRGGGGAESAVYNLGSEHGHTVREVIDACRGVSGVDFKVVVADRRAGDVPVLVANSSLARRELGWQPRYADLDTIVGHAWAWEKRMGVA